jgi:hypothetical protein
MEVERMPGTIVALYDRLADAEATLHELESAGVPYPDIRLAAHTPEDLDRATIVERTALAGVTAPDHFWSLGVVLDPRWADQSLEVLRAHQPFALGTMPAPDHGRGDPDRGAIAWRHYVFKSPAATDQVGESAGTTGTTGIITSGAFATGAQAAGNPPAVGLPAADQQPSNARQEPTSDTMRSKTSNDRSRPETKLKE